MKYLDTGSRNPSQSLAAWLQAVMATPVAEVRWQSGFFNEEPLGLFATPLSSLAQSGGLVHVLIGSNAPGTQRDDVLRLVQMIGLPRQNALLGVVQYSNAFFHPKVYHFRRTDGSQCAYVGSANLTEPGVSSLHVEAGLTVDTLENDPVSILNDIANAIDGWFTPARSGMHLVSSAADVMQLTTAGVLLIAPPPPPPAVAGAATGSSSGPARPASARLSALSPLPPLPPLTTPPPIATSPPPAGPASVPPVVPPPPTPVPVTTTTRAGFPAHVLFDPAATGPTSGGHGLSGNALPHAAVGLIIRLTKDDTRVFGTGVGTANINLPVDSISTLRFGILGRGGYPARPRAEFDMHVRYLGQNGVNFVLPDPVETNVMLYGYLPNESGHENRRMLLPADVRALGAQVVQAGLPVPASGHLALLEWPTAADPDFRISFLDPSSATGQSAQQIFTGAAGTAQMLADNACAMAAGVSPAAPW